MHTHEHDAIAHRMCMSLEPSECVKKVKRTSFRVGAMSGKEKGVTRYHSGFEMAPKRRGTLNASREQLWTGKTDHMREREREREDIDGAWIWAPLSLSLFQLLL